MTRMRLIIAALTALSLTILVGWQVRRDRLVRACIEGGGTWHGPRSLCLPDTMRPILQRDLHRS